MADQPPTPAAPAAGWYPDTENPGGLRYWDGHAWTEHRQQAHDGGAPPPPAPGQVLYVEKAGNGLAVGALVCGIVGLTLGLIPILFIIAWALGLVAIVLGIIARRRAVQKPEVGRKTMSTVSVVLGVLALAIGGVGYAIVNDAFEDVDEATEELEEDLDELQSP
jgi:Protein of unknown function (DUF2510)